MYRNIFWLVLAAALSFGTAEAAERPYAFTSFDFPGATATRAFGINANGVVVGYYVDNSGKTHGYLLSGGNFTSIDYPGALKTDARGINSQGDIVGYHVDALGLPGDGERGFLLRQGVFTAVDHPGHLNTVPLRITDGGQMVGCYHDNDKLGSMHGIVVSNGNFSELSVPSSMNLGATPDASVTTGIYYADTTAGITRGYLASDGVFAPFDFPFSLSTQARDMSPSGEIVGFYTDAAKKIHGFLVSLGDSIATFGINLQNGLAGPFDFVSLDYPGATMTQAHGINPQGDVVGFYVDCAGKEHGFFLSRTGDPNAASNPAPACPAGTPTRMPASHH